MLQSLRSLWTKQWTAVYGWTKVTTGAVVAGLPVLFHTAGNVLNEPKVGAAIDQLHLDPKIGLGLAVLGVVTLASMEHA